MCTRILLKNSNKKEILHIQIRYTRNMELESNTIPRAHVILFSTTIVFTNDTNFRKASERNAAIENLYSNSVWFVSYLLCNLNLKYLPSELNLYKIRRIYLQERVCICSTYVCAKNVEKSLRRIYYIIHIRKQQAPSKEFLFSFLDKPES